jgi:hypothetical protein
MRQYLPAIILVCLFLLGCAIAGSTIGGIRSGRFWYKGDWSSKGGDGIFFWLVFISALISGAVLGGRDFKLLRLIGIKLHITTIGANPS